MQITVNGETRELRDDATVLDLLTTLELEKQRVAVMVNGEIVRRDGHAGRRLQPEDTVDIVHMVGGG